MNPETHRRMCREQPRDSETGKPLPWVKFTVYTHNVKGGTVIHLHTKRPVTYIEDEWVMRQQIRIQKLRASMMHFEKTGKRPHKIVVMVGGTKVRDE